MALQKKFGDGQYHKPPLNELDPTGDAYVFDDPDIDPPERVVVLMVAVTDQAGKTRPDLEVKLLEVAIRPSDDHTAEGLLWQRNEDDRSPISSETLEVAFGAAFQKFLAYINTVGPFGT